MPRSRSSIALAAYYSLSVFIKQRVTSCTVCKPDTHGLQLSFQYGVREHSSLLVTSLVGALAKTAWKDAEYYRIIVDAEKHAAPEAQAIGVAVKWVLSAEEPESRNLWDSLAKRCGARLIAA